jgi:hypothetical protein
MTRKQQKKAQEQIVVVLITLSILALCAFPWIMAIVQ